MLIQTKEDHINFLKHSVLEPISALSKDEIQTKFTFLLIGQAIEILGAYLDKKPIRAKDQSSKRFELAIYKLFPKNYTLINKQNFLYYQLRNFLIHSFIPSNKLLLVSNSQKRADKHLSYENDCLTLCCDIFYTDFETAVNKLIRKIEEDKIPLKKITGSEIEN